ncbi:hypothetical protein COJ01_19980 [Priestia megaterium]|uniref:hypothetical protein n=1 Tax=Priestia megaterium TaxID=1404 RepID=UPI000BFA01A4|nr:hypothetical protein [Priestia megaterium]PFK99269.1 hypothetical protein COJ01_19980 [Priestia megaterium]RCX18952.1 hypothetical protein DEU47_1137 [Bacillus sp. AG236]
MFKSRSMESQKLINEKTAQRFFYETLSYGETSSLKKLYPPKARSYKKEIKVIIPEYPIKYIDNQGKEKVHRTDFRIIYKDDSYHNVEVEWKTSKFTHGKEVYKQCYQDNKGFLLVFEHDKNIDYIEEENISIVDPEWLSFWFLKRAKDIIDGTIANHVSHYQTRNSKNWLIYLPQGGGSKKDYLDKGRKQGKWAFRYSSTKKVMENILEIKAGDIVVFVWGLAGVKHRKIELTGEWSFSGLDIFRVKNGYYCDFRDGAFETDRWNDLSTDFDKNEQELITTKEYMHYFEYDSKSVHGKYYKTDENKGNKFQFPRMDVKKLKKYNLEKSWESFVNCLSWSMNNQGAPAELHEDELNALIVQLNL